MRALATADPTLVDIFTTTYNVRNLLLLYGKYMIQWEHLCETDVRNQYDMQNNADIFK